MKINNVTIKDEAGRDVVISNIENSHTDGLVQFFEVDHYNHEASLVYVAVNGVMINKYVNQTLPFNESIIEYLKNKIGG